MADDYALDDFDDYKEEDFDEESSPQSPPSIIVQPPKPVMGAQKTITTAPVLTSTALPSIGGQTGRASSAHLKPGAARPQSRTSHTSQTPSKIGASLAVENRQLKDLVQKLRQQLMNAVHGDRQIELQNKLVESQRELKLLKEENRALKRVRACDRLRVDSPLAGRSRQSRCRPLRISSRRTCRRLCAASRRSSGR